MNYYSLGVTTQQSQLIVFQPSFKYLRKLFSSCIFYIRQQYPLSISSKSQKSESSLTPLLLPTVNLSLSYCFHLLNSFQIMYLFSAILTASVLFQVCLVFHLDDNNSLLTCDVSSFLIYFAKLPKCVLLQRFNPDITCLHIFHLAYETLYKQGSERYLKGIWIMSYFF